MTEIQAVLRQAGLRSTAARVAVVQKLKRAKRPLSHGELADQLAGLGLDRATVFRNLTDLTDAGLIARAELGDHIWRFEWRTPEHDSGRPHPHFVCVDCGHVTCVPDFDRVDHLTAHGRAVGRVTEILFRGHCRNCVGAEAAP